MKLYEVIEKLEVTGPSEVTIITSRPSIKKDLEFYRNSGWNIDLRDEDGKTVADIKFENRFQIIEWCKKLQIHKLWNDRRIGEFLGAVQTAQVEG